MDKEMHEAFVRDSLEDIPDIEARRKSRLQRLHDVLVNAGPTACVAYASLTYLQKDPDTYRESEDDRSPAHVEFLALRALPVLQIAGTATEEEFPGLANEALHLVRETFADTQELLMLKSVEASRRPGASLAFEEYRRQAMLQALNVRGSAYQEHTKLVLDACFGKFESDCRRYLGFTAEEACRLIRAIPEVIGPRVDPRLQAVRVSYRKSAKDLKHLRRKGELPPHLAHVKPSEQRLGLQQMALAQAFRDPLSLALLTARDLAEKCGLAPSVCEAWLDAMHCPPGEYVEAYHHAPVGGHPVTRKPLIKVDGGYLAPAPMCLMEALRPRMEDALHAASSDAWSRYEAARSRSVEEMSADRLRSALPGARSWTAIEWRSATDSSDLDGLVHCDDLALRVQCKSGRISPAARRGAPSMVEDIRATVSDAAQQHARLTRALSEDAPSVLGFNKQQSEALATQLTMEVIVCLDDVTIWSTETHKLRHLVALSDAEQVPWVLSLTDLMAVTDLLDGAELVHFLTRRQRLEREGKVEAHDELDWVGHYIGDGLFFDAYFDHSDAPDAFRLLSYTEPIDTWYFSRAGLLSKPVPRPAQTLPPGLSSLRRRLEHDRPKHWLTAAVLLLNGDDDSRSLIENFMEHTRDRAKEVGWSNASQVFTSYGLTLWADMRYPSIQLAAVLSGYADQKIAESGRPNWLVLGLGGDGKLIVVVRETRNDNTLAHVLLRRDTAPQTGDTS